MKKIFKYMVLPLLSCSVLSCSYLEYDENKNWQEVDVWSEFSNIKKYMAAVYSKTPGGFHEVGGAFLAASTDNAEHRNQRSQITKFNLGTWSMFDTPNGAWSTNYTGIRLANTFIMHADTCTLYREQFNMAAHQKNLKELYRYRGEARFLKAFFYFELFKRYGSIPLVEDWADQLTPVEYERNSIEDVVNKICELCDSAYVYLPSLTDLSGNDYKNNLGHPFKGTAYALKSRAYLYGASKLSNPDGHLNHFYDSCAVYSAKLFNMGYKLEPDYGSLFVPNTATMQNNKEVIWDIRQASSSSLETANFPIGYYSGDGNANPTQDLVDAYEFRNGEEFDWSNLSHVLDIYNVEKRDKRFGATILFNGAFMQGREVECFEGGRDASNSVVDGTRTGYYLRKFLKLDADLSADGSSSRHYWPIFRYSEILLNYAEAMNFLYGPNQDPKGYGKTALEAINEVRSRAGLQDLPESISKDDFEKKLRNERRVELAFEGHRHWDVRRWKIAEETIGIPVHGVKIIRNYNPDGSYKDEYEKYELENRVFDEKMYLYPIPADEILMTKGLPQNPGW